MIALPPLLAGVANVTVACALPAVALRLCGAVGAEPALGVALFVGAEGAPVPALLVADTVKVYAMPLVRPGTTIGDAGPVTDVPPGLTVTL